jgi:hypothetical protein
MRRRLVLPAWTCTALVAGFAASDVRGGDGGRPAQVTQDWPQHADGAALPVAGAKDTDPNCPKGGRMWRWTVMPGVEPSGSATLPKPGPACAIEVRARADGGETWVDDAEAHVAGELGVAQQTRDGRDFWSSDATRGAWWSDACLRPLPDPGFTFVVTLTREEAARAETRPVRFRLTGGEPEGPPTSATRLLEMVETWTDPFGAARSVPLTAPMTHVGLVPKLEPSRVAAASAGLRGLVLVRGARAELSVRHTAAAGRPLAAYSSVERDLDDDDPSPSGLRATRAPLPTDRNVSVTSTANALDGAGKGSLVVAVPDAKAVVGFSFYVQAGVGADASEGLSCPLRITVVESLTDYDGDGRANPKDPDPLDPKR